MPKFVNFDVWKAHTIFCKCEFNGRKISDKYLKATKRSRSKN